MGNIANVKQVYRPQEWEEREQYYITEASKIILPVTPTSTDIMRITANIDSLLSEVLLEQAYVGRKYEDLDMKMKLAEKETFAILKQGNGTVPGSVANTTTVAAASKLTENDVKGLVVKYLGSHPLPGFKVDIYSLIQAVQPRKGFVDAVVKILVEKKGALISDLSMIKLEASIGNGGGNHKGYSNYSGGEDPYGN